MTSTHRFFRIFQTPRVVICRESSLPGVDFSAPGNVILIRETHGALDLQTNALVFSLRNSKLINPTLSEKLFYTTLYATIYDSFKSSTETQELRFYETNAHQLRLILDFLEARSEIPEIHFIDQHMFEIRLLKHSTTFS